MATYEKIEQFDRESDSWESYIKHSKFYFEVNGITESEEDLSKCQAIFLSSVGKKTYKLMCDLLAPENLLRNCAP